MWDPRGPPHSRSGSRDLAGLEGDPRDPATELQAFMLHKSGSTSPPQLGQGPRAQPEWQRLAFIPSSPVSFFLT